jgi:hypothetical protein
MSDREKDVESLRGDRARHEAGADPGRQRTPDGGVDRAARAQSAAFDDLLTDAGLNVVTTGIRIPRMNSLMERWIQTCRRELLDRTLIWNQIHLLHSLREFETFYNCHRPHRALGQAAPLRPLPAPINVPEQIGHLEVRRRDRLGGTLHEYQHAA